MTREGHQYSCQIRQRLVDSQGLGRGGIQQVWCDAINDGVTCLMGNDVPGQARVDQFSTFLRDGEVEELEAMRVAMVERVGEYASAGNHE